MAERAAVGPTPSSGVVAKAHRTGGAPLSDRRFEIGAGDVPERYAARLLSSLGARVAAHEERSRGLHPALEWAASGAMQLTGAPGGPPRLAPAPLASAARGIGRALALLAPGVASALPGDWPGLLAERAAAFGYSRRATTSPGGSCHLLRTRDGFLALGLARDDDVALLPAWLSEQRDPADFDPAHALVFARQGVRGAPTSELVERGRLIGLPVAAATAPQQDAPPWVAIERLGTAVSPGRERPLVIDLSSLWAGPLCGSLLASLGARVVKVESLDRPDGARAGVASFFDLLNAGKRCVALDLRSSRGMAQLRALCCAADLVIEGSRPRALRQLGIDAEQIVRDKPGLVWLSITGYGRSEPEANWVAFGDDAAIAAGLGVATGSSDAPIFCGDAIADPLTGMHAALAGWASLQSGGGTLIELSLRAVVAHVLGFDAGLDPRVGVECRALAAQSDEYEVAVAGVRQRVAPPRMRSAPPAAPLANDTQDVLRELGVAC